MFFLSLYPGLNKRTFINAIHVRLFFLITRPFLVYLTMMLFCLHIVPQSLKLGNTSFILSFSTGILQAQICQIGVVLCGIPHYYFARAVSFIT